jgi:predicted lipid-binding transport protein (Tim44 family)
MRAPESSPPFRIGLPGGFIAGLIVGLFLGWFFHGVVGLVVRLGFVLLLLIPLAIVLWYFFVRGRGGSSSGEGGSGRMQVYTWRGGQGMGRTTVDVPPPSSGRSQPVDENPIDVEFEELKRQVEDEGTPR